MTGFFYMHFGDDVPKNIEKEYNRLLLHEQYLEKKEQKYRIQTATFEDVITVCPDPATLPINEIELERERLHNERLKYLHVALNLLKADYPDLYRLIVEYYYAETKRIYGMAEINAAVRDVLDVQLQGGSNVQVQAAQDKLTAKYDKFVAKFGNLNDKANIKAFKDDISSPLLQSLERVENGEVVGKADIFSKRTVRPKVEITHVSTSQEALAISISERAKVDLDFMQSLTGFDRNKLISDLHRVIYPNPEKIDSEGNPKYEMADEYLSGNIRNKLAAAEAAAKNDILYSSNVEALKVAMPERLTAGDIDIRLGATWIPIDYIQQFILRSRLYVPEILL